MRPRDIGVFGLGIWVRASKKCYDRPGIGTEDEGQIDAVIDIAGEIAPDAVDVWIIEKVPRRLEVSSIVLEPNTRNA